MDHNCPINYHAPPNVVHPYFHDIGHRYWSFLDFVEKIASDENNEISRVDTAVYIWQQELGKLKSQTFVPALVKEQLNKLAQEDVLDKEATEITFVAKKSRRITDVGVLHRKAQSASAKIAKEFRIESDTKPGTSTAPPQKRKRESVDWRDLAKAPYVNAFRLFKQCKLPRRATAELKEFKLRGASEPDLVWVMHAFRQATSWRCLKHLAQEFEDGMDLWDKHVQSQENKYYIHNMAKQLTDRWFRYDLAEYRSNMEGWFLAKLHVPLMDIFLAVPYLELCATDVKGRNNRRGDKHDAVMRHEVYPLDLGPMLSDSEKVARSMAGNLQRAKELLLSSIREQKQDMLRSFGILSSGRFMDGIPVIYQVRQFEVPNGPLLCSKFIDGLAYMIAFKDRVLDFVTVLSETLANTPPESPPPSSVPSGTDDGDDDDDDDEEHEGSSHSGAEEIDGSELSSDDEDEENGDEEDEGDKKEESGEEESDEDDEQLVFIVFIHRDVDFSLSLTMSYLSFVCSYRK
ncbi:hypothetical protein BG000_007624 [Podila horticola]|nr:hypothetical protein BG000_007624 [Podila horticola]